MTAPPPRPTENPHQPEGATTRISEDVKRLRRWQREALQLLTDHTIPPVEWLRRRDQLVIEARTGK